MRVTVREPSRKVNNLIKVIWDREIIIKFTNQVFQCLLGIKTNPWLLHVFWVKVKFLFITENSFQTIDAVVSLIRKGNYMDKVDLCHAYRHCILQITQLVGRNGNSLKTLTTPTLWTLGFHLVVAMHSQSKMDDCSKVVHPNCSLSSSVWLSRLWFVNHEELLDFHDWI